MPYPALLALALVLSWAAPARAVQEWYDYYLQARDHDIPDKRWAECVRNLDRALQLRPKSGTNVRTYGMWTEDYLPHYYKGVCLLRQDPTPNDEGMVVRLKAAIDELNAEEQAGPVKRTPQLTALVRLRGEAQGAIGGLMTKRARAEVERLRNEAQDLAKRGSYDEALARLAQARTLAGGLDADTLRAVAAENESVRRTQKESADASARKQRLERRIADGQRLLEQGKPSDAKLAFDEAHEIDPADARAAEGRRLAQERILGTTTREKRSQSAKAGKALFDAGQYEQALPLLTDAALDAENTQARALLAQALKIVKGMRRQKELQAEIDRLMARGEQLMARNRYADAQVAFESVLRLDAGHARARERLGQAERLTGEALFARWLPNQPPMVTLFGTATVLESPRLTLQGMATDDRGIEKVEFRVGSVLLDTLVPPRSAGEPERNYPFTRELPLQAGPNGIAVTAYDNAGLTQTVSFSVDRRLRFYETVYFMPAALAGAVTLVGAGWGAQRLRRRRALRRRFNPYIAGAPVLDDDMFYGRGKLTQRMLSTLHRNSLMITGERRIGKTTFLHHLKRVLAEDEGGEWRFFPAFVDLQGVPEQAFFHALMADVVDGLALSGQTRERLRFRPDAERYEARDFSHDLPLVIEELRARTAKKVKLALLIDEVDVLNEYSESVNQRLRGIFMKSFSENLVAVMSGVGIRRRWNSEVSPWYNFFDEMELSPFSRDEAEALIREPVAGVFRFRPEAVDRILQLSGLRPYFIQKYCVHAVSHMLDEGRGTIRLDDVEAAREAVETEIRPQPQPAPVSD